MIRLATDVGGTFTDLVGYDERTGEVFTAKSLTTAHNQSEGVLDAIDLAERDGRLRARDVTFFVHGGTTVINAITERKGVKTALVTTAGFRDVLEIGRGNRPDLYNLQFKSPLPFVPRSLRFEVRERMDAKGRELVPLALDDIDPVIAACRDRGVRAIAVVFLHSYVNPGHEIRCARKLAQALPDVSVCASHDVSRQWREYERSNTAVLNAYVQPIIKSYFTRLDRMLVSRGLTCARYAMQSNGGMSTFDQAVTSPLTLVESGPAGGIAGAARIGTILAEASVLSLDVGGTTAKCALIQDGRPMLESEYKLEHTRIAPGYTVQVPVVDIVEIGSGGGSIAQIDERGLLSVGPESAGSEPGPACYGRGGDKPTLSDALLTLGIFDPVRFAGGQLQLDRSKAAVAIATVARPLDLSIEDAALAIVDIAHASMINALKLVTVRRGHDPRDAALVVSGGAGPALAARLGRDLQVKTTVIPRYPGIFSAWGMLAAEPRADFRCTWFAPLGADAMAGIRRRFEDLKADAVSYFGKDDARDLRFTCRVEARYRGQEHGVFSAFEPDDGEDDFRQRFHAVHEQAYTFRLPHLLVEVTMLHLEAVLSGPVIAAPLLSDEGQPIESASLGERPVYFGGTAQWLTCPVYDRARLPPSARIDGPLLVEDLTATLLVLSGQQLDVSPEGLLLVRETGREHG